MMAAPATFLAQQHLSAKGNPKGGGKGKTWSPYAAKRAAAAEVKAQPNWIKAVSNSCHLGLWAQFMYPHVSDDGLQADLLRPNPNSGVPLDKCGIGFVDAVCGEYCEVSVLEDHSI